MRYIPEKHAPLSVANDKDLTLARDSSRALSPLLGKRGSLKARFGDGSDTVTATLPAIVLPLIIDILSNMSQGKAVTIIPVNAELTSQQAADILNVSRPFLVKLLDDNTIPYRKVGTHRRICLNDILEYKKSFEQERNKRMNELANEAQSFDFGY